MIYVGIDVASDAINLAKDKVIRKDVSFECRDFFSFVDNNNGCFDLITFIGSIDYMELNDFFFQGLNKITTSKSRCLVSKFHPFWTTLYANDVDSEQMYTYFDNGRRDAVSYGTSPSNEFERFHYTIGYLIESFKNYGWSICKFLEPRPDFSNSAFKCIWAGIYLVIFFSFVWFAGTRVFRVILWVVDFISGSLGD